MYLNLPDIVNGIIELYWILVIVLSNWCRCHVEGSRHFDGVRIVRVIRTFNTIAWRKEDIESLDEIGISVEQSGYTMNHVINVDAAISGSAYVSYIVDSGNLT